MALLKLSEAHRASFPVPTQGSTSVLQAWTLLLVRQRVLSQVTQCRGAVPKCPLSEPLWSSAGPYLPAWPWPFSSRQVMPLARPGHWAPAAWVSGVVFPAEVSPVLPTTMPHTLSIHGWGRVSRSWGCGCGWQRLSAHQDGCCGCHQDHGCCGAWSCLHHVGTGCDVRKERGSELFTRIVGAGDRLELPFS